MNHVGKRFGSTVALESVDLAVEPGEVHALVGENGAGKSTLMKVLSGALTPDRGDVLLHGVPYRPRGPADARRAGVATIYQELTLAPHLTVAENVMLGREQSRLGWQSRAAMKPRVEAALASLDHPDLAAERRVADLGPGARQLVEVARALAGNSSVLVMDEPTSSLSARDTEKLFDVIRKLRGQGVAVIYISHFLEEVEQIAQRYTVLRDGVSVATGAMAHTSTATLVEAMAGRKIDQMFPRVAHQRGDRILEVRDLRGVGQPHHASFDLHRGEILGITGLVGAGRTEMLRAILGLDAVLSGAVTVATLSPAETAVSSREVGSWLATSGGLRSGIGLLSEDRKEEGLATSLSIEDNLTLPRLGPYVRGGWLFRSRRRRAVADWLQRLSVRVRAVTQPVGELSGGNQQKVALARLLHQDVDVMLLDEPTRGIDVGSKAQIYRLMGEWAAKGKAILFVSSYVPELLGVCDRLAVMYRGKLGPVREISAWNEARVLHAATHGDSRL